MFCYQEWDDLLHGLPSLRGLKRCLVYGKSIEEQVTMMIVIVIVIVILFQPEEPLKW